MKRATALLLALFAALGLGACDLFPPTANYVELNGVRHRVDVARVFTHYEDRFVSLYFSDEASELRFDFLIGNDSSTDMVSGKWTDFLGSLYHATYHAGALTGGDIAADEPPMSASLEISVDQGSKKIGVSGSLSQGGTIFLCDYSGPYELVHQEGIWD
jgi:hypothetical protein